MGIGVCVCVCVHVCTYVGVSQLLALCIQCAARCIQGWLRVVSPALAPCRVHFDIERKKLDPSLHIPQQVFLSCNYCGKSINAPGMCMYIRTYVHVCTHKH